MTVTDRVESSSDDVIEKAERAFRLWRDSDRGARASSLRSAARALHDHAEELLSIAQEETGLQRPRLVGELRRTCVQLEMFAEVVESADYLGVRIDVEDAHFALGQRPDLRRSSVPIGPVLNFAAGNFPFAFSVAGGDSASALAAGCSVIVKGHPGHVRLGARTAELVSEALSGAGAPEGLFQFVLGDELGVELLRSPGLAAASFTGSTAVGQMLARVAAERPRPIPFFGELGSVNPVFVSRSAMSAQSADIAAGFCGSVSGSAGQLCTKPGFLFVPDDGAADLEDRLVEEASAVPTHRMLTPSIAQRYLERKGHILGVPEVRTLFDGQADVDDDGQGWVKPTFATTTLSNFERFAEQLRDETFGPFSLVVTYSDVSELSQVVDRHFAGNLTGTIHVADGDESLLGVAQSLANNVGRVLFNQWPTGVAVTPAMQHGGPWPATTDLRSTSVGTAAIERFVRPITFQNTPNGYLPSALRDDALKQTPHSVSDAGSSQRWTAFEGPVS